MRYRDYSAVGRCLGAAETFGNGATRTAGRAVRAWTGLLTALTLCGCGPEAPPLVLTKPLTQDTMITHLYACQIRSSQRTEIRAPMPGYLQMVNAREGQSVKEGDVLFNILPHVPKGVGKDAEAQEGQTAIKAPFTGRMGGLRLQSGSQVNAGDVLTRLSDNSVVWADFNVPEAHLKEHPASVLAEGLKEVRLKLVNGKMFDQPGVAAPLKKEADGGLPGTLPYRAVFPNPNDLLRQGETGNIRLQLTLKNALLVPRRSTFERAGHRWIYVVDKDQVLRQRQMAITHELGDYFVVSAGVKADDTILFDEMDKVHDGEKAGKSVFEEPAAAYAHLKLKPE
ncbi:MAG: efflux RND transporter periplasmic adaptor subunit [Verrucomicrobia bacterium]|nr:efflux RND transporter periplasmic adaptor subunit [Verrucomicrobiota bacterium]